MSSLTMGQVSSLAGLRGLGAEELDPEVARQRAAQTAEMAKRGVAIKGQAAAPPPEVPALAAPSAAREVAASRASSSPQRDVESRAQSASPYQSMAPSSADYSTTSLSFAAPAARARRVSPLAVSWQFPFAQRARSAPRRPVSMGWAMVAVGLVFGGVALYLVAKD